MSTWSSSMQVCASCRYWCGKRKPDAGGYFIEAQEDKGQCAGPMGSFRGAEMAEGSGCSEWESFSKQ